MNKEILYSFFNGSTTIEDEIRIRQWMEFSEENKEAFFRERKLFDALQIIPDNQVEYTVSRPPKKIHSLYIKEILKIASVILITLGISTIQKDYQSSTTPVAMQTITVPAGQYIQLGLPDGTAVWLNARTTLRYPVNFNTTQRTVELDGEAYFEVAKKEDSPFVVSTEKHEIEVLGTKFNVESYKEKGNFITTLMEGKVRINSTEAPTASLVMNPDSKVVYENGKLIVHHVDDYTYYRWREGLICFTTASFSSIMNTFEKIYGIQINILNNQVSKYHYTGKFRQTDGVDYALRVLQRDISFKYIKDDDNQSITIK